MMGMATTLGTSYGRHCLARSMICGRRPHRVRIAWKLCPEAQSRSTMSLRVNSTSQSGSGAVMMTSHTSSAGGGMLLLQLADKLSGLGFGPGHAAPAGDDIAVVAEPDPSAGGVDAVGMQ